jgi:hypothetical protein
MERDWKEHQMKFKLLKTVLVSIYLSVSSFANAGLVIGNQEFLELGATDGMTVAQVEAMIAGNASFTGYALATDVDMENIYQVLPFMQSNLYGWNAITIHDYSIRIKDTLEWLTIGTYLEHEPDTFFLANSGTTVHYNNQNYGWISFKDSMTGDMESGHFNVLKHDNIITAIENRAESSVYGLQFKNTTAGDYSTSTVSNNHSLFVRAVSVPEPSTLAILALGMIGLASRRSKKQS